MATSDDDDDDDDGDGGDDDDAGAEYGGNIWTCASLVLHKRTSMHTCVPRWFQCEFPSQTMARSTSSVSSPTRASFNRRYLP